MMSDVYLLDTSVASPAIDPKHQHHTVVRNWMGTLKQPSNNYALISTVTIGEVAYGLNLGGLDNTTKTNFKEAIRQFGVIAVNEDIAKVYGELRAWIVKNRGPKDSRSAKGKQLEDLLPDKKYVVGENDLWIASSAVAFDMVYVTLDSKQRYIFEAADAVYSYNRTLVGIGALGGSP